MHLRRLENETLGRSHELQRRPGVGSELVDLDRADETIAERRLPLGDELLVPPQRVLEVATLSLEVGNLALVTPFDLLTCRQECFETKTEACHVSSRKSHAEVGDAERPAVSRWLRSAASSASSMRRRQVAGYDAGSPLD